MFLGHDGGDTNPATHSHIPEDQNPLCDCCGNLTSPKYLVLLEGKMKATEVFVPSGSSMF
jgi:hypothetical protein